MRTIWTLMLLTGCSGAGVIDVITSTDAHDSGQRVSNNADAGEVPDVGHVADSAVSVDAQCPTWYIDADNDGYGSTATARVDCTQPVGWVSQSGDCNDTDKDAFPGSTTPGAGDNNCDGKLTLAWSAPYTNDLQYSCYRAVYNRTGFAPGWENHCGGMYEHLTCMVGGFRRTQERVLCL